MHDSSTVTKDAETWEVSYKYAVSRQEQWLAIEALAFGLAYSFGLCWTSVCFLASFRPNNLSAPYWSGVPGLRADTSGILALFVFAVFFSCSEFLRFRRRRAAAPARLAFGDLTNAAMLAISETVGILATGVVIYLSINTVTHPATLSRQATHLASWPTEGTLRVIALVMCMCSVTLIRFLRVERKAGDLPIDVAPNR